jgi:uncharacterized protein YfaA (DUF2138 family)
MPTTTICVAMDRRQTVAKLLRDMTIEELDKRMDRMFAAIERMYDPPAIHLVVHQLRSALDIRNMKAQRWIVRDPEKS